MKTSFFGRYLPFFGNRAVLVMCLVFFLLPFALRGARLAINGMKNDVTDWLPKSYRETEELAVFRRFFLGDQFVVITWPGCRENDPSYLRLLDKLKRESLEFDGQLTPEQRRAHRIGDQYALQTTGNYHEDWGAHGERWLKGRDGWFFIKRDGSLYQWDGDENVVQGASRALDRFYKGKNNATGKFITQFRDEGAFPANDLDPSPYYLDPTLLTARFFKSVTSGPEVFKKLAGENGVLRLGNYSESDQATFDVKTEAHQKLTGLLFGPTPPRDFAWTFASLQAVLRRDDPGKLEALDANRQYEFEQYVQRLVGEQYGGELQRLRQEDPRQQLAHWFDLWDKLQLPAPERQTCIIAYLNEPALDDLSRVVGRPLLGKPRGRIQELASGHCGIDPANLRIGGPPVDNVAIDEEGSITLLKLVGLSALIGLGLAYWSFRSVRLTLMMFFVGGVSAVMSLSLVWFAGSTLDAILMTMPSLVYVLGISGAVHIINYYRDAGEVDRDRAVDLAIRHGWFPCTLCAFTTALGLFSLCTSYLAPIRKFGWFSAIATMATVLLLFSYLPAALYLWPSHRAKSIQPRREDWIDRFLNGLAGFVTRRHGWIVASFMVLLVVFGWGATRVETTVHLLKLFDRDARILHDYRWLEENLGALVPMEILVRIPPHSIAEPDAPHRAAKLAAAASASAAPFPLAFNMLERAEISQRIRRQLESYFGPRGLNVVGAGTSADTFMPLYVVDSQLPTYRREELARNLTARKLDIARDTEYYRIDPADGSELWRISLRLAALSDVDYGQFISEIRKVVEPILAAYRQRTELLEKLAVASQAPANAAGAPASDSGERTQWVLLVGREPSADGAPATQAAGAISAADLFCQTLTDLLQNRGFAPLEPGRRQAKTGYFWLTSQQYRQLTESRSWTQKEWRDFVGRFDLVVAIEPFAEFAWNDLRAQSKQFLDWTSPAVIGAASEVRTAAKSDAKAAGAGGDAVSAAYTGIVPIVYKAQRSLLESLQQSIVLSFVMISLVMMLLLRNWRGRLTWRNSLNFSAGLISMLPNILPIVVVFGWMGLRGAEVDIGSMMTASVAMGIAVDDTIHFLNWYREALRQGLDRVAAIRVTYRRVARAMLQTTLIAGFGLSAFAFSTFTPTQRFGVMMLFLLAVALIGDLVFLPALLAGPLGRSFGAGLATSEGGRAAATDQQPADEESVASTPGHSRLDAPESTSARCTPHRAAQRSDLAGSG